MLFQNTYAKLPEAFFEKTSPSPVISPTLIALNEPLAQELNLDPHHLRSPEGLAILAGNKVPPGAQPISTAYSGHQFANFNPMLGDGRAILLGEINGFDLQLKGSGPTPFSRRGDGRSALGPVLREYLVSEAMHQLGIPTTRALAAVSSGELVYREHPEPGGVFTRVASSHLRIGTAQYFAARRDLTNLQILVDYAIQRHYPDAKTPLDLLTSVIQSQAQLIAQWMGVGFIHGVMNTDNMSLSGETIDYGPCAFMDQYNPAQKYSYIDQGGRYAYHNQPTIAQWNLARLAETLLPIIHPDLDQAHQLAITELQKFPDLFEHHRLQIFANKIGLPQLSDWNIIQILLDLMTEDQIDFTLTFHHLTQNADQFLRLFKDPRKANDWLELRKSLGAIDTNTMRHHNSAYIPRNHLIEEAIQSSYQDDHTKFNALHKLLQTPYQTDQNHPPENHLPLPDQIIKNTFCGT